MKLKEKVPKNIFKKEIEGENLNQKKKLGEPSCAPKLKFNFGKLSPPKTPRTSYFQNNGASRPAR